MNPATQAIQALIDAEEAKSPHGWLAQRISDARLKALMEAQDAVEDAAKPSPDCSCRRSCGDIPEERDHPLAMCKGLPPGRHKFSCDVSLYGSSARCNCGLGAHK